MTEVGWTTKCLTIRSHHFLQYAPPTRPLLLLLDGHLTHNNPGFFFTKAACEHVIVFCLPPNTTHLVQSLDKGVFGTLKIYWYQACQEFMRKNPGQVVTEFFFNEIFSKACGQAVTFPNAPAAFLTTGVYPFNRLAVKTKDSIENYDQLSKEAGLPFLPMLTPARPSQRHLIKVGWWMTWTNIPLTPSCHPTQALIALLL